MITAIEGAPNTLTCRGTFDRLYFNPVRLASQRLKPPLVLQSPVVAACGKSLPTRTETIISIGVVGGALPLALCKEENPAP